MFFKLYKEEQPFYLKTWFLILMFFMIPPAFLILLWLKTRSKKLIVGMGVFFVCVVVSITFITSKNGSNVSSVDTSAKNENSFEFNNSNEVTLIMSATKTSKEQAAAILSILNKVGLEDIKSVEHDDLLDHSDRKGYRVGTSKLNNVILYLNNQKQIHSVRFDGNDLYVANKSNLKNREINVSLPPYNLKGDGTDETKSIQALLNLAKTRGSVHLYFPKGVYSMSGYLRLYKNTTIRMHPEAVIKRLGTGYKVFINGQLGNKSYANGYNGEGNIHFSGGTIDLNSQDAPVGVDKNISAFDLGHGKNISFTNLTVKNGQNGHYFQISSSANVRFKNCTFKDVYHNSSTNDMNYEVIQIEVATKKSFPTFGGYDRTISRNIVIDNCIFENVIRAIGTHSDGTYGTGAVIYSKNVRIQNSKFIYSIDNMLNFTAFDNLVMKNNRIEYAGGYGIYAFRVKNSMITDNIIINTQKKGILTRNSTITR